MANELPTNVSYGTVTGRYLLAYADSSDVGLNPDGIAAGGEILFTPLVERLRDATSTPPVTIIPKQVACTINVDGYLCGPDGLSSVRLLATDDADLDVVGWLWQVTYLLTDVEGSLIRGIPTHTMSLPGGTTVDLITIAPVAGLVG
jgi:hypothetical protein